MKILNTELGRTLREMRKDRGQILGEMAERGQIPISTLSSWENGRRQPSLAALRLFLNRIGLNATDAKRVIRAQTRAAREVAIPVTDLNSDVAVLLHRRFPHLDEAQLDAIKRLISGSEDE